MSLFSRSPQAQDVYCWLRELVGTLLILEQLPETLLSPCFFLWPFLHRSKGSSSIFGRQFVSWRIECSSVLNVFVKTVRFSVLQDYNFCFFKIFYALKILFDIPKNQTWRLLKVKNWHLTICVSVGTFLTWAVDTRVQFEYSWPMRIPEIKRQWLIKDNIPLWIQYIAIDEKDHTITTLFAPLGLHPSSIHKCKRFKRKSLEPCFILMQLVLNGMAREHANVDMLSDPPCICLQLLFHMSCAKGLTPVNLINFFIRVGNGRHRRQFGK
jgi:hypothetical protein